MRGNGKVLNLNICTMTLYVASACTLTKLARSSVYTLAEFKLLAARGVVRE